MIDAAASDDKTWAKLAEERPSLGQELFARLVDDAARLWPCGVSAEAGAAAVGGQGMLFSAPAWTTRVLEAANAPRAMDSSWDVLIRDAYLAAYKGSSIDKLIADPDATPRFIQECWKRGLRASPFELTWLLYNARKANKIGPIPAVERYVVSRSEMDQYLWATEIALRIVQDEAYFHQQRNMSLDRLLCHPVLAQEFESIARKLAPGFQSIDYRWAALCIRKSHDRKLQGTPAQDAEPQHLGSTDCVRASSIPDQPGLFWLSSGGTPLLVGQAENLRGQFDRLMSGMDRSWRRVPDWVAERVQLYKTRVPMGNVEIAIAPNAGCQQRDLMKRFFLRNHKTAFNALRGRDMAA